MNPVAWVMEGGVKSVLGKLPSWVWIALAVIAALVAATIYHGHKVRQFGNERYQAGVAAEDARVAAKANAIAAQAAALTAKIRSNTDETNRRIAVDANALRVRGPGKAACPYPAASGSGGHVDSAATADASVDPVPDGQRPALIALPFPATIDFAEAYYRLLAEVKAWRDQHDALDKAQPQEKQP